MIDDNVRLTISPPKTEAELLARCQVLAGKTLGQIAAQLNVAVPENLQRHKGWVGNLLENYLGANAGNKAAPDFMDLGIEMKAVALYKTLGLTGSPMLYKYMDNEDITIDPERAKIFLDKFDVLINDWGTPEELLNDCNNRELGAKLAYEPIREIVDAIVDADSIDGDKEFRRAIKVIIAKWF